MYRVHSKLWIDTMYVVWQDTCIPRNSNANIGLNCIDQLKLWVCTPRLPLSDTSTRPARNIFFLPPNKQRTTTMERE